MHLPSLLPGNGISEHTRGSVHHTHSTKVISPGERGFVRDASEWRRGESNP